MRLIPSEARPKSPARVATAEIAMALVVEGGRRRGGAAPSPIKTRDATPTLISPVSLLGPHRDHRIDLRRASSRNCRRDQRDPDQQRRHPDEGEWITRLDLVEPASKYGHQQPGASDTDDDPRRAQRRPLPYDEAEDIRGLRAERDADTELLTSLRDRMRHDAIDADDGEQ